MMATPANLHLHNDINHSSENEFLVEKDTEHTNMTLPVANGSSSLSPSRMERRTHFSEKSMMFDDAVAPPAIRSLPLTTTMLPTDSVENTQVHRENSPSFDDLLATMASEMDRLSTKGRIASPSPHPRPPTAPPRKDNYAAELFYAQINGEVVNGCTEDENEPRAYMSSSFANLTHRTSSVLTNSFLGLTFSSSGSFRKIQDQEGKRNEFTHLPETKDCEMNIRGCELPGGNTEGQQTNARFNPKQITKKLIFNRTKHGKKMKKPSSVCGVKSSSHGSNHEKPNKRRVKSECGKDRRGPSRGLPKTRGAGTTPG